MAANFTLDDPLVMTFAILAGIALLGLGRRLFWLFVGVAGFVAGLQLAADALQGQEDWILLVVALVAGVIGAALAVVLQQIAIRVGGFLLGGYLVFVSLTQFGLVTDLESIWLWAGVIVGAVAGMLMVAVLFELALIGLSALGGAALIVQVIGDNLEPLYKALIFVALVVVGVVVQAQMWQAQTEDDD